MPSITNKLAKQGIITPPPWLESGLQLEVIMGSRAYGCNQEDKSDYDIRGIFIPPKTMPFPAVNGLIVGYDQIPACEHFQQSHVIDPSSQKEYDFDIHNICKFIKLAEENNPNKIDLLFASPSLVKHCSAIGTMLLDARHLFLSKLCWKRYRGYSVQQYHYIKNRSETKGKRKELIDLYGYDVKFASHCLRLLRQSEQILTEGTLDLFQGSEELKSIRRGEWTFEQFEKEFIARKEGVEKVYHNCKLPEVPDHDRVRELLMNCLEHYYGNLNNVIQKPDLYLKKLREVDGILDSIRNTLY